jgi:hypothetical protein
MRDMSKRPGTTESDTVRKRTLRSLVLYSTPNWLDRAFAIVFSGVALYWSISGGFKDWVMYVLLAASGLAILQVFMRSHVEIDYDQDIIETKLWKVWSFIQQSRHGLADATAIQIEVHPMVESKSMVKKSLVFSDVQRIELPEIKEIEIILSDWYEHFFQRRLPIQKNKRA